MVFKNVYAEKQQNSKSLKLNSQKTRLMFHSDAVSNDRRFQLLVSKSAGQC